LDRNVYLRRRIMAIAIAIAATAAVWFLFFGGDDGTDSEELDLTIAQLSPETEARLAGLDTAAKVDQLILASDPPADSGTLGGLLVSGATWQGAGTGPEQTEALREQADGEIPVMVGTTQEGGNYRELADLPPEARAIQVGDEGKGGLAETWGEQTAAALEEEGFDFNIGPLADIATLDSAIADRAFSDDGPTVERMTASSYKGCGKGGILCVPAHFPGQGAATQDTALGPASISVDAATLRSRDVPPFEAAFREGAPGVVISNAIYTAYDPVTPASLAPEVLDGLLRRDLGYEGVAITDELEAGAIRAGRKTPDAAVEAIFSGADMVLLAEPESIEPVRAALLEAAESGQISTDRLDSAAGRVLEMKQKLGLLSTDSPDEGSATP
jgi:beta-N-acetylhexosaminidase